SVSPEDGWPRDDAQQSRLPVVGSRLSLFWCPGGVGRWEIGAACRSRGEGKRRGRKSFHRGRFHGVDSRLGCAAISPAGIAAQKTVGERPVQGNCFLLVATHSMRARPSMRGPHRVAGAPSRCAGAGGALLSAGA
ncbi:MAG: hypothetical protein ACK56I_37390, partial [bacterium]